MQKCARNSRVKLSLVIRRISRVGDGGLREGRGVDLVNDSYKNLRTSRDINIGRERFIHLSYAPRGSKG